MIGILPIGIESIGSFQGNNQRVAAVGGGPSVGPSRPSCRQSGRQLVVWCWSGQQPFFETFGVQLVVGRCSVRQTFLRKPFLLVVDGGPFGAIQLVVGWLSGRLAIGGRLVVCDPIGAGRCSFGVQNILRIFRVWCCRDVPFGMQSIAIGMSFRCRPVSLFTK